MSRNKERITKALKSKGYEPRQIEWTPIGGSAIMCGPEGGWYIDFEPMDGLEPPEGLFSYDILCYNINEVLEEIERLPVCQPITEDAI